jgi:hypothetical protein
VRLSTALLLGFILLGGYVWLVRQSVTFEHVPLNVNPSELRDLIVALPVPAGLYELQQDAGRIRYQEAGRIHYGPPDDTKVPQAAVLFGDSAGTRLAVQLLVTGLQEAPLAFSYDAICTPKWASAECDIQYDYRNISVPLPLPPVAAVGERTGGQLQRLVSGGHVRSDSFLRAGIVATVSVKSLDDSYLEKIIQLLKVLDAQLIAYAIGKGVDVEQSELESRRPRRP